MFAFNKTFIFISWILLMKIHTISMETIDPGKEFNFTCFDKPPSIVRIASPNRSEVITQVSDHVLHQIVSRIFIIYMREILGFNDKFTLKEVEFLSNTSELLKLYDTLEYIVDSSRPTIDIGVWMPSDHHMIPDKLNMAGLFTKGRYGWFFPKSLLNEGDLPSLNPYTIFQHPNTDELRQFIVDDELVNLLQPYAEEPQCLPNNCDQGMYVPDYCQHNECALLFAPTYNEAGFVIKHIKELKLYVKVFWMGNNLESTVNYLLEHYTKFSPKTNEGKSKKILVLYRTPSEIIDTRTKYEMITMPRCETMKSSSETKCKYELTPLLKYYSSLVTDEFKLVYQRLSFSYDDIRHILNIYGDISNESAVSNSSLIYNKNNLNKLKDRNDKDGIDQLFNSIACKWMKENEDLYNAWFNGAKKEDEFEIGGIFPISINGYKGLIPALDKAESAVSNSMSVLSGTKLTLIKNDGNCQADEVLRSFINVYNAGQKTIGVLGPACSETVEPIAGISKHFNLAVVSYSAEGASFMNRDAYPYFFRTIGDNRQYKRVYLQLMQEFGWHRIAALTEDGQKYTEYISHMETVLNEHNIELIINKKFQRNLTPAEMSSNLLDLKQKNSRIIIADIYDEVAPIVMCEAYKLDMTAQNGYVWFLPVWLSKTINGTYKMSGGVNVTCTDKQILDMFEGHFTLSHAPFAEDDAIMQENKTVGEWRREYELECENGNYTPSFYAGYAYDGVWVYAYALDKLLREDPQCRNDLHSTETTNRLIKIISDTDFQGVSGHIKFGIGGSRFSTINVMQWVNGKHIIVGSYYPEIFDSDDFNKREIVGGKLNLTKSLINWIDVPTDGTIICTVDWLAGPLGLDCTTSTYIIIVFACFVVLVVLSIGSFMFWKHSYDKKLKQSAKVMRNFGIDLLSPSSITTNTLDKWEVPKDRVVINRRLGEGAFGTVYGGEAQLSDNCWTAVAVKTLKVGSGTEERLDFLSEAEAMKRFDHKNIIKLLGVCLQTEPIYTIMDFMLYGDLKTFLLARRHLVGQKITDDSDVSPKRLTIMVLDVARALSYLADMKYVHRDVACRNCLVNAQRVVKLGDFGMARPMFENDYYKFSRKGMLPVRWMSPESLGLGIFSPASDVWSFGVLLYEIITFGSFPFQGLTNNQVLEHVKNGNTLPIPNGVKPQLEGLMKACWNTQYKKRPTSSEITEFISNYPRLITPCLDVPLASVEMADTDSDQLELLPGLRKRNSNTTTTGLTPSNISSFDGKLTHSSTLPNGITLKEFNVPPDVSHHHNNNTMCNGYSSLSNAYNPIEPLLQRDEDISRSSLSLRRYVPMCGFKRSNRSLIEDTSNV